MTAPSSATPQDDTGRLKGDSEEALALRNQVATLNEFAEFCHNYYTGTSRAYPGAKWEYGYEQEVITMAELFIAQGRIIDAVATDPSKNSPAEATQVCPRCSATAEINNTLKHTDDCPDKDFS